MMRPVRVLYSSTAARSLEVGSDDQHAGDHLRSEEEGEQAGLAAEVEAGEAIARQGAQDRRDQGGHPRDQDAV